MRLTARAAMLGLAVALGVGICERITDDIKIVPAGTRIAAAVARGEVEIGIRHANVIQPDPGTGDLGLLPSALIERGRAGAGLFAVPPQREVARIFVTFMTDPANAPLLRKGSMEPAER